MADAKYSELPPVTTQLTTSVFGVEENGVSKGTTIAQIQGGSVTGAIPFVSSTGIFVQDSSNLFWDSGATRLGIGTNSPEGTLHISTGAPSSVFPTSQAKELVVQSEGDAGITIFSPDSNVSSVVFGSPGGTGNEGARVRWSPTANLLNIVTTETGADILIAPGFLAESIRFKASGNIGIGTSTPDASAKLEVSSTTQGFLPPRMTSAQRDAIASPSGGIMIFNTTTNALNYFGGVGWRQIASTAA